ncbi:glycine oxidase [Thermostichus sp. MS-CIW-19]|uniref:NAD(P)/FAD-dependent oxidoreductase n=1 Tax=unclassified Synechococcus TaxID=2626047 RepID=UPI000315CECB|nr:MULTISPECIES: FAD-dependent oxidoreductase [unclassified Synechococcus]PIK85972.1 FAD-dependent oxidoreductase [Synechococcus sp. 63AY4M2]PIK89233.1 FAD-dependent oxidoreductase [Synechococcus sp. 65AY6A5]PIK91318.1 FAD-dependent oxidoreductase [Synechococcus sp. 65AY6Li]PIK95032.1 FAD-dependent oxidoreductase [Synechococcus sp. 60AY4M2]PIK97285.1 FAD-dependent oxidoreductase [Synechococcus sp. 63AY4M1]
MNCDVLVIGCGVVGCAIAYELATAGLSVVGIDARDPASGATGASLGVLMGICSRQPDGEVVQLRLKSLEQFDPLIARLEADLGRTLPVNRHGILKLLREEEVDAWQATLAARRQAGYRLEFLSPGEVGSLQPGLRSDLGGALYSPQDRQIQPRLLTQALVEAAQRRGCRFFFHQPVQKMQRSPDPPFRLQAVYTPAFAFSAGHVVLAAGLDSSPLAEELGLRIPLQAVKGQALRVKAAGIPLGPVVSDEDLHLVPLGDGSLWVGATVEFQAPHPQPTLLALQDLLAHAIGICPALAEATLLEHWAGHRPRPLGQRAPILGPAPGYVNLLVATGHYRNGVLLAPISAAILRDLVLKGETALCDLSAFAPRPKQG